MPIDYAQKAKELRKTVLGMTFRAQSSHIGSNFSAADLMTVLYNIADFTQIPGSLTKDIVVVKSWAAANVYALLVDRGLLSQEAVDRYGEEGTKWTTILEPILPYIPAGTGAMGYHLPFAVGFAMAKKLKKEEGTVYCLISDGECDIGSTWEAAQIAAHHKLDNLVMVIDKNGFQAMGEVKDILDLGNLRAKFRNFGWNCGEVDGHDFKQIVGFLTRKKPNNRPTCMIGRTIKGKGFSEFENNNLWHYSHVNKETLDRALAELK